MKTAEELKRLRQRVRKTERYANFASESLSLFARKAGITGATHMEIAEFFCEYLTDEYNQDPEEVLP